MATCKVPASFVLKHAKYMIVKCDQKDAIEADKIIDRLFAKKRGIFKKVPVYASRTEVIERNSEEERLTINDLFWTFNQSAQRKNCEKLAIAAHTLIKLDKNAFILLSEEDFSSLGYCGRDYLDYVFSDKGE